MQDDLQADSATPEQVRSEVRSWLEQEWDPDLSLREWRERLVRARWAVPSWPARWFGRGLPLWADDTVASEIQRAGAIGLPVGAGMSLAAPTILAHGPDSIRERFLLPTLTGAEKWCQLFSEPGAGSDLAGVSTGAVRDGDRWMVSGQKVWNTSAHHADFGILLARTDWDAPKHRGVTYFVIPMHQPGVEVRPLKQMNFHSSFNEVFLTEAVIPADYVVGQVHKGWTVALTTLNYERRFAGTGRPATPDSKSLALEEARAEAAEYFKTYEWYPQRAGRVDLLVEHARAAGRAADSVVRQELVRALTLRSASAWTAERARAQRALGRPPGAEGSIGKLASSNLARKAAAVHSLLAGANGMLSGADGAFDGVIGEVLVSVPAVSIAGGTDEIQKNILAERVLGLPREPSAISDLPFRKSLRNA